MSTANFDEDCCPKCESGDIDLQDDGYHVVCAECGHYWDSGPEDEDYSDPMDGDAESALASCGFGMDEDYGGGSDIDFGGDDY